MILPEKTGIYGYLQRPSLVDFPGQLAMVCFTAGCNFSCGYCHNAPLMGQRAAGLSAAELQSALLRFRKKDWITGVTVTGGEPTLLEQLPALIRWLKGSGLKVKLDTNGSHPAMLEELLPYVDYIAMDVKCALEDYPSFVQYHDNGSISRSIDLLRDWDGEYEFRTTILEAFHDEAQMLRIGEMIRGARRYTLQPFVPRENLPDPAMRSMKRTSPDLLSSYADLLRTFVEQVQIKGIS